MSLFIINLFFFSVPVSKRALIHTPDPMLLQKIDPMQPNNYTCVQATDGQPLLLPLSGA